MLSDPLHVGLTWMAQNGGVSFLGMLWGIVLGDWFTSTIKSKGLFLSNLRASVGQ